MIAIRTPSHSPNSLSCSADADVACSSAASFRQPDSEFRTSLQPALMRTSASKGHEQLHDSSVAFGFEVLFELCGNTGRNFKSAALASTHIAQEGMDWGKPGALECLSIGDNWFVIPLRKAAVRESARDIGNPTSDQEGVSLCEVSHTNLMQWGQWCRPANSR